MHSTQICPHIFSGIRLAFVFLGGAVGIQPEKTSPDHHQL